MDGMVRNITDFSTSLFKVWNQCKRCEALDVMLQHHFISSNNPYESVLVLVRQSPDYNLSRPNGLSFTVIDVFSSWVGFRKENYKHCLSNSVKVEAFQVASRQRSKVICKYIIDVYELKEDKLLFLKSLYDSLRLHMYKEVCEWSMMLDLESEFGIFDFVIPLIFQDKLTIVDEFLEKNKSHHLDLIKFLDNILIERNIMSHINQLIVDLKVENVKHASLSKLSQTKPLSKMMKRFAAIHHTPPDAMPNLTLRNGISTVNFLVRKKYYDRNLSNEAFRELVKDACGSRQEVINHLVDRLDEENDPTEALICARLFSLPVSDMPPRVRQLEENGWKEDITDLAEGLSGEETQYHNLSLSLSSILIIDTEAAFASLLESSIDGASIVGIDLEWKPTMVASAGELALLQLAKEDRVYLVDVLALAHSRHLWSQFAQEFLDNHNILKIGFSMSSDSAMLAQCFPIDFPFRMSGLGFLDLSVLWNKLLNYDFEFPFEVNDSVSCCGLSQLVAITIGKPLNKKEQFSNWETRPLRSAQKVYAALDAFCLIEIYEVIKRLCEERNIPLDDIVHDIMTKGEPGKPKKPKANKKGKEILRHRENATEAKNMKLVCEPGLAMLASMLRRHGIDTLVAELHEIPYVSETGGRIALVSPWIYQTVSQKLPKDMCYMVRSFTVQDQYREVIRRLYIIVKREDMFTRCQDCNSCDMVVVNKKTVEEWLQKYSPMKNENCLPAGFSDNEISDSEDDDFYVHDNESESQNFELVHGDLDFRPTTSSGVPIKLELLPNHIVQMVELFHVCQQCGLTFWQEPGNQL